jgi:uncharacterized protein GlcG (DUF336 family)
MSGAGGESPLELAQALLDAGLAYCREQGLRMSLVVIDANGAVRAGARMDGARPVSFEIALAKANTAREFEAPTSELKELIAAENRMAIAQLLPRPLAFIGGGLPIRSGAAILGALGVSGGKEAEDVAVAEQALAAVARLL